MTFLELEKSIVDAISENEAAQMEAVIMASASPGVVDNIYFGTVGTVHNNGTISNHAVTGNNEIDQPYY